VSRLRQGGLIDRSKPFRFTFDGKPYQGFAGDTLASALLANDVSLVARSFKYHRPRGIFSAGSDEPNALVELRKGERKEPNTRATVAELYDGLAANSQNRWPSLSFDVLAANGLAAPFLGAGFYYKTFMWPARAWEKLYEPLIRRAAGLGRAAMEPDPDAYEKRNAFCDLLVIGAGPSGLMATLTAARSGARVILADEDFRFGGRLLAEKSEINGASGLSFLEEILAELSSLPNVELLPRTTVFGVYDGGTYGAVERVSDHLPAPPVFKPRQRLLKIFAKQALLAAGAIDRPIVFGGNDRPGVMSARAHQTFANRFAVAPASCTAYFVNNDGAWRAAFDAAEAGATVDVIIDIRPGIAPDILARAKQLSIRAILDGRVVATSGKTLRSIDVITNGKQERLSVTGLAVSSGLSPNIQLTCHHGGKPQWNEAIAAFVPGKCPPGLRVAGSAAGIFGLAACLADGASKGAEIVHELGFAAAAIPAPHAVDAAADIQQFWHVTQSRGPAFVDLQNDVTAKDITIAHGEGFRSVEHLKRYTTLGMATDQGKTSNVTGLAIMASLTGQSIEATGTTIFRPPYTPVAIGVLAGHHRGRDFRPARPTPTHQWAESQGARFVETGLWLRAQYFPRAGESDWLETVTREVTDVRENVGLIDVSTFGKIDLQGKDSGALLDFAYINMFSTLPVGRARYGVMLREDGIVMDDGTTTRFGENHYVMTTTTVNAAKVFQHLEFCLQVLRPDLDVQLTSVSEQWAQIAIAGPNARKVLAGIVDSADISNEALPFMGAIEADVLGGTPARIFRLSFSGELGYEIAVPARDGQRLAQGLMDAGRSFGITPYGTEALGVMRIEKGHVSGSELNGQTSARDLGLGRMASSKKDYIGRVMAQRPAFLDPDRPVLTGFRPVDRSLRLRAGAHFLGLNKLADIKFDEGYMTSVAYSPSLQHWIGLGMLKRGPERIGEIVRAYDPIRGADIEVEICAPAFVDPEGVRLRG
jgi:sarcosine oxidase subunit alpha